MLLYGMRRYIIWRGGVICRDGCCMMRGVVVCPGGVRCCVMWCVGVRRVVVCWGHV